MSEKMDPIDERLHLRMTARLKIDHLPRRVHVLGIGGTLAILAVSIVLFLVFNNVAVWADWQPASEFTNPQYAERIYPDSIFRTRMNTWSNLAFILFGFYAIALGINDWKKGLPLQRGYLTHTSSQSFLFGAALIYTGLGSGFFHASLTRYGQQCDVGGMYSTMLCMAAIPVGSWLPRVELPGTRHTFPSSPLIAALVVFGSLYFTYFKWDYSFGAVSTYFGSVLLIFAGITLIQPGKYLQVRWFILAIATIILAAKIRELDIQDQFSSPDSIFQGHAIWHLMSSLYYVFIFLYFRSEERVEQAA